MNIKTVYYFYEEDTHNPLHTNDRYTFIWEYFDDKDEAYNALRKLGEMLHDSFGYHPVNLELELRTAVRVYSGDYYYE